MTTAMYDRTCAIQRRTRTDDGRGGGDHTWAALYSGVHCARQPAGATERERYSRESVVCTDVVYMDFISGLKERDRIVEGSDTLDIVGIRDMGGRQRMLAVDVELVK